MSKQKKIMLLGGLRYLLPAIEAAHKQGYYVITADYLPNNIAHKYSDEYVNVSIIDKEAVLQVAREKQIDGILSFAVDPGVVTAAYVQEQMGLPSMGPYESVVILQNKDQFRQFLRDNGFNVPWSKAYHSLDEAISDKASIALPCIVKPVDSAGSKGVTKITNLSQYEEALRKAFAISISHRVIVEQFIEAVGCSSDTDCFSYNGQLQVATFNCQYFDANAANPFTPAYFTWPSTMSAEQEHHLTTELQRLITLLGMKTTMYNVESRIGTDGKAYLMEVSPRAGGNRLAEMVRYASGMDMITATVRAAVGDEIDDIIQKPYTKILLYLVLYAKKNGVFQSVKIAPELSKNMLEPLDLWVKTGDVVTAFQDASSTIGTLPLEFSNRDELYDFINNREKYINIIV